MLRQIKLSQVQDEVTVCPYCMDGPKAHGRDYGCCGESSAHFVKAYDLGDEFVLMDEVEIIDEPKEFIFERGEK